MPTLHVSLRDCGALHADGAPAVPQVQEAASALPPGAPVIVMIHGFKYCPGSVQHSPHTQIFADRPRPGSRNATSRPRHLGFGRGTPDEGLCIAFGWPARGSIWRARSEARRAGRALAHLLQQTSAAHPAHLVAHSLGAEVAITALRCAPGASIGRLILMAAAAFRDDAEIALSSAAGLTAEIVNITSAENRLFDGLFRAALRPVDRNARSLGAGLGRVHPRWVDLAIDEPAVREHLGTLGHRIPPPHRRVCHWWGYRRPGLFRLYRALLRNPALLPLTAVDPARGPALRGSAATVTPATLPSAQSKPC